VALVGEIPLPLEPDGSGGSRPGQRHAPGPDGAGPPPLTDAEFSRAVEAVTSAFGDPTRRRIYLSARERSGGVTASEVAERFALHANVARHHLDKLAAGGYLEVFVPRPARTGAGRPSKHYRVSGRTTGVEPPRRHDDLLVLLLGQALSLVPAADAEVMAERVGEDYGRSLAAQLGTEPTLAASEGTAALRTALQTVAEALSAHGFAAHAEARGGSLALIKDRCPFFDTAQQHPVICAVDRGMVRGMLASLYGEAVPASMESSRARGDDACITLTSI
jgi:predicted ArsR family transcriptional regulator